MNGKLKTKLIILLCIIIVSFIVILIFIKHKKTNTESNINNSTNSNTIVSFSMLKWGTTDFIEFNDSKYGTLKIKAYGKYSIDINNNELIANNEIKDSVIKDIRNKIANSISTFLKDHSASELFSSEATNYIIKSMNNDDFKITAFSIESISYDGDSTDKMQEVDTEL